MSGPELDRDAAAPFQDQIDDLTAAVVAQRRLLDAHGAMIIELARLAGLGDTGRRSRPDRPRGAAMADTVYLPRHLGTVVGSTCCGVAGRRRAGSHRALWPAGQQRRRHALRLAVLGPDAAVAARRAGHRPHRGAAPLLTAPARPAYTSTRAKLRDPDHQVLRTHPAGAGPDEQALAACFGMARAAAARTWLIDQAGADARTRIDAVLRGVGLRLPAGRRRHPRRPGRPRPAQRPRRQAAMAATTLGRPRGPAWSFLENLSRAAAAIVDEPAYRPARAGPRGAGHVPGADARRRRARRGTTLQPRRGSTPCALPCSTRSGPPPRHSPSPPWPIPRRQPTHASKGSPPGSGATSPSTTPTAPSRSDGCSRPPGWPRHRSPDGPLAARAPAARLPTTTTKPTRARSRPAASGEAGTA